jgi:hypothetical protein
VALVDELDRHADIRRDVAETPAEHAARLRRIGRSRLSLDLLAADYALARYGGVALRATEDRRGVGRWRALRKRIPTAPPGWVPPDVDGTSSRPVPEGEAAPPTDAEVRRVL